jgi:hypothetical protein
MQRTQRRASPLALVHSAHACGSNRRIAASVAESVAEKGRCTAPARRDRNTLSNENAE